MFFKFPSKILKIEGKKLRIIGNLLILKSIYVKHHSLENCTIMFTYVIDCKSQLKSAQQLSRKSLQNSVCSTHALRGDAHQAVKETFTFTLARRPMHEHQLHSRLYTFMPESPISIGLFYRNLKPDSKLLAHSSLQSTSVLWF